MWRSLDEIQAAVVDCRACPRLVAWREGVAAAKVRRFSDWTYWGRPVPSFGDAQARFLIIGLAPAAHGGNRTGRMFTGDRSGDWLYAALHRAGFANQGHATDASDGLQLVDCRITASCRCAPPDNKPSTEEFRNCRTFLEAEVALMPQVRVVLALGQIAWEVAWSLYGSGRAPKFAHGVVVPMGERTLVGSYHPSQRNTQTGLLTQEMFDAVFRTVRDLLDGS